MKAVRWLRTNTTQAAVVATLAVSLVFAAVGFVKDAQQDTDRVTDLQAGQIASCERGNEIRLGIRELARDLDADPETIAIVDERFADVDCTNIRGG